MHNGSSIFLFTLYVEKTNNKYICLLSFNNTFDGYISEYKHLDKTRNYKFKQYGVKEFKQKQLFLFYIYY